MLRNVDIKPLYNVHSTPYTKNSPITFGLFLNAPPRPYIAVWRATTRCCLTSRATFHSFYRVSIPIYAKIFDIIELLKKYVFFCINYE